MQSSCNPIFPGRQVRFASTAKSITPFGGLVSLIAFFEKIGMAVRIPYIVIARLTHMVKRKAAGLATWTP